MRTMSWRRSSSRCSASRHTHARPYRTPSTCSTMLYRSEILKLDRPCVRKTFLESIWLSYFCSTPQHLSYAVTCFLFSITAKLRPRDPAGTGCASRQELLRGGAPTAPSDHRRNTEAAADDKSGQNLLVSWLIYETYQFSEASPLICYYKRDHSTSLLAFGCI